MYITCYIWMDINWIWLHIWIFGYDYMTYLYLYIYFLILPNHISMVSCKTLRFLSIGLLGWKMMHVKGKGPQPPQKCECMMPWPRKTCKTIDSRHRYCMNIDSHVHIKLLMHVLLPHVIAMYTYMYVYVFSACTIYPLCSCCLTVLYFKLAPCLGSTYFSKHTELVAQGLIKGLLGDDGGQ